MDLPTGEIIAERRMKTPVQPWQTMMPWKTVHHSSCILSRRKDWCWSRFLMPKRWDYFGRGCHLVPSCPSRKSWSSGSRWQCSRRLHHAPNDSTAIAVPHPHLSKLHPPLPSSRSIIIIIPSEVLCSSSSSSWYVWPILSVLKFNVQILQPVPASGVS